MTKSRALFHRDDLFWRVRNAITEGRIDDAAEEAVRLAKFARALLEQRRAVRRQASMRRRGADGVE